MNLPDWVNIVLTNEFDDDPYWEYGIESECPEAYYAITNIQQSPSDINQFVYSRMIYDEYIDDIIDYYGGMENIRAYMEEYGQYPPGYCDPPKLSISKKKNRAILRSGVIPQKIGKYNPTYTGEGLSALASEMFDIDQNLDDLKLVKPKGKMKKKMIKEILRNSNEIRMERHHGAMINANFDIISQRFYNTCSDSDNDDTSILSMSYDEIADLYDKEEKERNDPWKPTEEEYASGLAFYSYNRIIPRKHDKNIKLMKILQEQGFNPMKLIDKKKLSKNDREFYREQLGINIFSKKELKEERKKAEEAEKELRSYYNGKSKMVDSMRSLTQALTRNSKGYSSDTDEDLLEDIIRRR